jgi:thiamine transport system permease protein
MKLTKKLSELFAKRSARRGWNAFIIFFFALFVLLPTIYVLSYIVTDWGVISTDVLSDTNSVDLSWSEYTEADFLEYEVHKSTVSNFNLTEATLAFEINNNETTHTVLMGLSPSTVYYFKIGVVNESGNLTANSNEVNTTGYYEIPPSSFEIILYEPIVTKTESLIYHCLWISFEIAAIVTLIDFIAGLPMAWMLVRKDFRGKRFFDTFLDMPLAVPTAALGFSTALFWAVTPGILSPPGSLNLLSSPMLLIIVLHIVFSYPYMVRSLAAILQEIDINYEIAGETCGASRLTAARTITLPLFRAGLVTGIILCFARSLSETGGTMVALATLGSMEKTGPVLIGTWKHVAKYNPNLVPALAFTSILLILLALVLLVIVKIIVTKAKLPLKKVWPIPEKFLSRGLPPKLSNLFTFIFLLFIVLIPSFFIFSYVVTAEPAAGIGWGGFWSSLYYSFLVATIITVIDLALGIPMAILIVRGKSKKLGHVLDTLINIPLIVPTSALGFSLGLFWATQSYFVSSPLLLIIFAHVAFTYPLVVRNVAGALEETDVVYEETARTLGAKPIQVFRKVMLPMIRPSILAGAIMAFTRSLGETGATLAVSPEAITAPVYIVRLIKDHQAYYQAGLACIILIAVSYCAMLLLRYITKKAR